MFKGFRFNVILRLVIILIIITLLAYVFTQNPTFFLPAALLVLLTVLVSNLIVYIERSNRNLARLLISLRQSDFTLRYPLKGGKLVEGLSESMNEIIDEFARVNEEKEMQFQFLQTLNESIHVGILSFEKDGTLISLNRAAKEILKQPVIKATDLRDIDEGLYDTVMSLQPEEKKVITLHGELDIEVSVLVKEIKLKSGAIKIVLLQNLTDELQAKEVQAWQTLIRVLTHEIMNSVTPIFALADAGKKLLSIDRRVTDETLTDVKASMETIAQRSEGLLKFIRAFKEFSRPLEPDMLRVELVSLVTNVIQLLKPSFAAKDVSIEFSHQGQEIFVMADRALLEQVIINLLKNALEASTNSQASLVSVMLHSKQSSPVTLLISDNGIGMDEETLAKIFVPFFTTKPSGTGIGLSFSRRVVLMHGGSIKVNSAPGEGATFAIQLPGIKTS